MAMQHLQAAIEATLGMETLQFSEQKRLSTVRAAAASITAQQLPWQTAKKQLVVIVVMAGTAAAEKGGGCGSKARQQ